ncbi:MAG: hypothetical protein NTW79_00920 [Candidatus Berkelbacteria bacterium]|nr:hypothetical protein [Candidatus Berkelbacteria bacterium]
MKDQRPGVKVISFSRDRKKAQIAVIHNGGSVTRHVKREADGQYHWREQNLMKRAAGTEIHEVYAL